jgi:transposase
MNQHTTKKVKNINKKTLIVTIDISKTVHYGYLRAPDGKEVKPFAFFNVRKSFEEFWATICAFKEAQHLEDIVIGFESSGPYAEPLFHFLLQKPVTLVQVNPLHTKRLKELTGNSPNKTDQKDPRVIADVIALGHALTLVVPEGPAAELRRLTQARERALKGRTALVNRLQQLVFIIFPEFLTVIKQVTAKTARYLLQHYPTPQSIITLGIESLTMLLKKISRGKYRQHHAQNLFTAAQHSVGIGQGIPSIVQEIQHLVTTLEHENTFIDRVEKQMHSCLDQIPYSSSILSIKGIGAITAAGLIGEVGDFRKFSTIAEIMKLAGLDLFEISSGRHQGQRHISKRGRPLIRKLLFFAAINAVRRTGIMHAHYKSMRERGMPKLKALIAIARKLLCIIFALARNNTTYVENYSSTHNFKQAA